MFRDSSSTSKTLFDEYKGITRRSSRKNRVKLRRKISIRMSNKLKIPNKYFFEVVDSNVMKERVVSANNVVFRRIQRNERINLSNIVENNWIDRKSLSIKSTKIFVLKNASFRNEVENGAIMRSGFHKNDIMTASNGYEFFNNGRRSSRNMNKFDVARINRFIIKSRSGKSFLNALVIFASDLSFVNKDKNISEVRNSVNKIVKFVAVENVGVKRNGESFFGLLNPVDRRVSSDDENMLNGYGNGVNRKEVVNGG